MRRLPTREGFTLIELLIVIVIVGILATIAIKVFWTAKDRGMESTLKSDLRTVAVHQETWYERNYTYAEDIDSLVNFSLSPSVELDIQHADPDGWAAVASSPSLIGMRCGFWIGSVPNGLDTPATMPGRVQCGP
jgi:prepilin-type N-terminal cleavage/methylation domain-containing protein